MFKLIWEFLNRLFKPKYPLINKDKAWPEPEVGYTVTRYNEYGIVERSNTYNWGSGFKIKRKIISLKKEPTLSDEIYNFVMNFKGTVSNYGGVWLRIHKRVKPENYDLDYLDIAKNERAIYNDGHPRYVNVYTIKHGKHGDISDLFNPEEIKNMYIYLSETVKKQQHDKKMNDLKDFIKKSPAPGSVVIKK